MFNVRALRVLDKCLQARSLFIDAFIENSFRR